MTGSQALAAAAALGVERLDAQLLLLQALGREAHERAWLLAHDTDELEPLVASNFAGLCERRARGEPLAYIYGSKEFYGVPLSVDARVLVPRPDTETLVSWALELMLGRTEPRVIDLGTGSGAIALSIARERPDALVEAVDASDDALAVASSNSARLGLRLRFRRANWLDGAGRFDLIVSNPPYVAEADPHLHELRFEPLSALVSGPDGLSDLRKITGSAAAHLFPGGWLLLEHGWDQAAAVRELLEAAGFGRVQSRRDLAGIERCSGGILLEK